MALNAAKVAQAAKIKATIKVAQERLDALMEHIRAEAPAGVTVVDYKDQQIVVKATPKVELDTKKFIELHPFEKFPQFYKTAPTFSAPLVDAKDREGFTKPGTTAVEINLVEKA